MPRFHLGTWLTWTIATPIGSLVVSGHGNAIWSAQIKPLFANGFIIAFASQFSLIDISFFLLHFLNRQHFKTGSHCQLTEHGSFLIRRLFARFDFLLTSYYGVIRCFIITRHGLHGKPALYIYRSCYLLQQCGFMKPPLQDWLSQLHAQRWQVLCISKIWSYA